MFKQHTGWMIALALSWGLHGACDAAEMDAMWGETSVKTLDSKLERGQLFSEGNYAMFIHWGLYSQLANKVDGKTYYGIGEWIMHDRMAGIPVKEYKKLASTFNPTQYDAKAIARLAKEAGMRYVVITSKHHEGFALFDSPSSEFDVMDASPWKRDALRELSDACHEEGIGFGVYYSHFQDWTAPGGGRGPGRDAHGKAVTFHDYFYDKCLPQVEELTTQYGPLELIWFDTPADIKEKYVKKLVEVVRKNQPGALINGRVGYDCGDFQSQGDMEVPHGNIEGLWESVDTINDSWAFAWYDEYWKTPKNILGRLIACVGRGGTYMLNVGPRGDGSIPERSQRTLRSVGEWIHRYSDVIYGADPSPWGRAMPWGDVTVQGNTLNLAVFDWPTSGRLLVPGLETDVVSAHLLNGGESTEISHSISNGWVVLDLPWHAPESLASVIELELAGAPVIKDASFGIDPDCTTEILAEFSTVEGATLARKRWMEKFGEWKSVHRVHQWKEGGKAVFEVDVMEAGDYSVDLTYTGEGRIVWGVEVIGGEHIQNQQNSSRNYQRFPMGWLNFPAPGRYQVAVSCLDGDKILASLKSIQFKRVE